MLLGYKTKKYHVELKLTGRKLIQFLYSFKTSELNSLIYCLLDAIYDCASLYNRNYRISGLYKLPKDDFLGTPELEVSS